MNRGGRNTVTLAAGPASAAPSAIAVAAEPPDGLACVDLALAGDRPGEDYGLSLNQATAMCEAMASSCGDSEGRVSDTACPSQLAVLLHELSNLLTGILLNAQMLEWKLPPYSHLKRLVREMTRNAQRGSELMKRLHRLGVEPGQAGAQAGSFAGERTGEGSGAKLPSPKAERPDPAGCDRVLPNSALPKQVLDLTTSCDTRTSNAFPKRDDRDGR